MNRIHWNGLNLVMACVALGGAAGQAVGAERLSREQLRALPPEQLHQYVLQRLQDHAKRSGRAQAAGLDVTPPTLSKFSLPTKVRAGDPLVGKFSAADDQSGVWYVSSCSYGPHGQSLCVYDGISFPATQVSGQLQSTTPEMLEPGTYTFSYGYVGDVAGNWTYYDQAALAALGNTVVQVQNGKKYDAQPGSMLAGQILTPSLSLSATQPGTNTPIYAGMQIDVQDNGDTGVSGIQSVGAEFCLLDFSHCLYVSAYAQAAARGKQTFVMGGQPGNSNGLVPGDYHLYYVYMRDLASNYANLVGTEFGGNVDFSQMMPSTVITLTP